MIGKLLIANRGEIACRIARTARRMGIRTVAVYSDADARAAHVAACDEAVHIGGSPPQESYLRGDVILEVAKRTGADAIHPGYGFLSENAEFAAACEQAGVRFVGPPASAIAAMGSKSAAKDLMDRAGVPLTPGYHGENQDPAVLAAQAARIGYPVLIKAVAGGGGKGMRRVDRAEDFADALASCRREAASSFKDDRVLLEKFVNPARHIEMQVFGDRHGNVVHLFERDCSVQRRHQKILEEAPAPGMTEELRRRMGAAAVAAARAVNYVGAGTVEFIVAPDGGFYFMEMNTRLQVEHPVTEMITGLDLVEWQFRVAAGEALPLRQEQLMIRGHAFEARIYAEDSARDFLPSIGRIEHLVAPAESAQVRIDTGVRQGDEITPYYDPMIAKLIVHGGSRDAAMGRLRRALAQYEIVGVRTNVEFLHQLTKTISLLLANLDTALIEREKLYLFEEKPSPPDETWELAARSSQADVPDDGSPWSVRTGWRLGSRATRDVRLRCGVHERTVMLRYDAPPQPPGRAIRAGSQVHIFDDGTHHVFEVIDPYLPPAASADAHGGLTAPMPGRVLALNVKPGDTVKRGAALLVMEAMKMEHTVTAPADGRIEKVLCAVGDQVREGAELLVLAPV